jgi:hypothetical protein
MQAVRESVGVLKRGLHSVRSLVVARHNQGAVLEGRGRRNRAEFLSEPGDGESQNDSDEQGDAFQRNHIVRFYRSEGEFPAGKKLPRQSNRK